jgi:capsular exopolysaccharide synthesis family protein
MHFQYLGHVELRDQVPVSPNRAKLLLLSLGVGILLAIGVPFLIEFLDHTVTSPEQVEQSHRLRALGIVPLLDKSQLPGVANVAAEIRPVRQVIENFRVIRTNLLSAATSAGKEPQVVVVASAMPEEGKTFVAYNLARSFAQMGEETLLIDGDLRRGRIHRMFGHRSNPGLSNILAQTMTWREACRPSGVEKLSFISRGKHLEGSTEMFASTAFSSLLDELRRHFKRIVIDTPPVLGLSETAMIQPFVDGVVLVIWGGRTSSQYVKSAVDALQTNRAHLYGFVLNRLDLSVTSNYYNYYNYYYYSYHYYKSYKSLEAPADLPKPPEEEVRSS